MTRALGTLLVLCFLVLQGCAAIDSEQDSEVWVLLKAGEYHEAMRLLPRDMQKLQAYCEKVGNSQEGAVGYLYVSTMYDVAVNGDRDWGKILDDPTIPYEYKTDLIFEILESRLGKGAIYTGNADNLIVPRRGPIDLDKDKIVIPATRSRE